MPLQGRISTPAPEDDYRVLSVQPTEPPGNLEGSDWHCYEIAQGENRIRGYRRGNFDSVRKSVDEIVVRLNERRIGKGVRVQLRMSAQNQAGKGS
jgi:hypothetical protein